jgi:formylglycine-generating enzyme required for sulfatase activity
MAYVEGGAYLQGDTRGNGSADEKPVHRVNITAFYLSPFEETFEQYDVFAAETGRPRPADNGWGRGDRPVINVTWLDAAAYCNWLSERDGLDAFYVFEGGAVSAVWEAKGYRLPTEAEWEYAARSGAVVLAAAAGTTPGTDGWHNANAGGRTHSVGTRQANQLELYDMLGNVWEWCNDWYGPYGAEEVADPRGPTEGTHRVLRGGSWYDSSYGLRFPARNRHLPTMRLPMAGFRLARSAP